MSEGSGRASESTISDGGHYIIIPTIVYIRHLAGFCSQPSFSGRGVRCVAALFFSFSDFVTDKTMGNQQRAPGARLIRRHRPPHSNGCDNRLALDTGPLTLRVIETRVSLNLSYINMTLEFEVPVSLALFLKRRVERGNTTCAGVLACPRRSKVMSHAR